MIDRDELAAWLRLIETPGVGRSSARRLLSAFASPQAVFAAGHTARSKVVDPGVSAALRSPTAEIDRLLEATWQWLDETSADAPRAVLVLGDADYPKPLLETADPPLLLYLQGDRRLLEADSIAVVGSRNPTPQGAENARAFALELGRAGYAIVSGMALGIDAAAHLGGLDGGGSSIGFVGTGLDRVYPSRNHELALRLSREGLLVSEYALGTPPLPARFPQRNRLIAGLSLGTLVVEAALQSGSLITARLAAEAGREVFAIPGSIHSPQSRGCHRLIKEGAQLVDSAGDIIAALQPSHVRAAPRVAAIEAEADLPEPSGLLAALGHDPASLEALIARTGCSAQALNAQLLELELLGKVARLPGQLFQRIGLG